MLVTSLLLSLLLLPQTVEQGITEFNKGNYDVAKQILGSSPASETRDLFLALAEAATGRCATATVTLSRSYAQPEYRRLASLALVQCFLAADRMAEAFNVVSRLETEFPADADVLYQAARFHMRAFNDAVNRMYQRTPSSYRVNQLSGEIFEVQGRTEEAIAEFKKAIAKNPKALNLHYRLGRALAIQSQYDAALSEFEAELKLNAADPLAEYQVGQILAVRQRPAEAIQHFERALALKSDFVEAMVALARLKHASAVSLLEKAVAIAPRNESARYGLMLAYRNSGRLDDAQKQKAELDKLQRPPEGEFTEFLKKLGEKPPQ